MYALSDLLFSPVFHRHPKLKVALSEGGIGWVPFMLERADYVWERHRFYQNVNQERRPSELYYDHIYSCFIEDHHGLAARDEVGMDNILWECDYPHSDSNWPNSRKVAEEVFTKIPDEDVHKIVRTQRAASVQLSARREMSGEPIEPIPPEAMLGASDWDEEDLLTVVEASDRLAREISAARERIRRAEEVLADGDSIDLAAERKRLEDLMQAVDRIRVAQANAPR